MRWHFEKKMRLASFSDSSQRLFQQIMLNLPPFEGLVQKLMPQYVF